MKVQCTKEMEKNLMLPFLDIKMTRVKHKIHIGIYRKPTHTLKYLSYNSYRQRNEHIGILKHMYTVNVTRLQRDKKKLIFWNMLLVIHLYNEQIGIMDKNERAKKRTESIVVPYTKGVSEKLRKDLSKEDVNLVVKKRPGIAHKDFQWKIQENDGRGKDLIYKIPCSYCKLCYIGETAQW